MRTDEAAIEKDMKAVCGAEFIPWEQLQARNIFITGGTGLIGSTLIHALLYSSRQRELGLHIFALVRNRELAEKRFEKLLQTRPPLTFLEGTVEDLPDIDADIDHIIHAASQTASMAFVNQPVETIHTAVLGTENVLRAAREKQVRGLVYLSSMEVYGYPEKGHKVAEDEIGAFSPMEVRNSYPISKVMCENLCCAYAKEYGVPATILRLTQVFGPGMRESDHRIVAEFDRCVKEKRDIVLRTKGETERSYLYTADAAAAVLCVLLKGTPGMAYNAADETTYCSIAQRAQRVAQKGGIGVRFEIQDEASCGYLKPLYMDLCVERLKGLGWKTVVKDPF